jgi:hypothetical protein
MEVGILGRMWPDSLGLTRRIYLGRLLEPEGCNLAQVVAVDDDLGRVSVAPRR